MKIVKWLASAIVIAVLGFVFVANYSAATTAYECSGKQGYSQEGEERSDLATMFLKLEEYRWWVRLWNDSDGTLTVEIPDDVGEYYDRIEDSGQLLEIWKDSKRQGLFSKLSMQINLKVPTGYFSGTCKKVDRDLS